MPGQGSDSRRLEVMLRKAPAPIETEQRELSAESTRRGQEMPVATALTHPELLNSHIRSPLQQHSGSNQLGDAKTDSLQTQSNGKGEFYYPVEEVDEVPRLARSLPFNPAELSSFAEGGMIQLELFIDEFGKVRKVTAWPSSLPENFRQFAVLGFLNRPFKPALKEKAPVKSRMRILVEFAPLGTDGLPRVKTSYFPNGSSPEAAPISATPP